MADNEMRIKIRVDQSQYQKAMKDMGRQQDNLTQGFTKAGKAGGIFGKQVSGGVEQASGSVRKSTKIWQSFSTGLGTVTMGMTPMTAALQLGGKAALTAGKFVASSVKDYSTFQNTLKQVQIIAGGTDADMKLLGDTAMKLGANTSIGAQEVANAEVEFAKLGFTAKETSDAMTGIVYAAEASGSSVGTTSEIVAAALNTWNLKAEDATHVADVMAQTANKTAADMTDLGYTFQYAGAAAQLGGASMEQLAAYTGIMADQGIKGSKAGTTLRTAFTNLTSPTENAAAKLAELGVSLKDAEGNARPIPDVIADLQDKMQGMSKSDILDISTILFGKTGAAGMSMVLQKTRDETKALTDELVNSTGTAEAQAKKMRDTLAGQLDQISDGFATLKLKIGEAFTPLATEGAKAVNGMLDGITEGFDNITQKFSTFSKLNDVFEAVHPPTQLTNWLENAKTGVDEFGTAVANMDQNMQTIQTGNMLSGQFREAKSQMDLVSSTFDTLSEKASNYKWINEAQLTQLQTDSATVVSTIQTMSGLIAVETAKYQADPNYNPSAAISKGVTEGLPNLQAALDGQLSVVKTSQDNQMNALTTFLNNSDSIDAAHKAAALAAQATHNQNQQTMISDNNAKIIELYSSLGTQTQAERQSSLMQIESLERQNQAAVVNIANAKKDGILMALQAQADSSGQITQSMKDKAIADADQQRNETIQAAQDQYVQSVAAINSMSDEAIAATGKTREQLISDARTQATETISQATKMHDETVSKIDGIKVKAEQTDGKKITIKSAIEGAKTVLDTIQNIRNAIANPFSFVVNVAKNVTENVIRGGKKKARGGLTSGVGLGMGSGSATYHPTARAMGVGTQLGQGGISQGGGVTTNERGREVTMPVSNATYMRPFARAVADELQGSVGGGSDQTIVVPLYINGREFARATNQDMTKEQNRMTRITNRARGK